MQWLDIFNRSISDDLSKGVSVSCMAPETLKENVFGVKTDVWTMGSFLYRIFTHGSMPFEDHIYMSTDILKQRVLLSLWLKTYETAVSISDNR